MGTIKMKGGTPCEWTSLCKTCSWAHIVTGFRESELIVICTEVGPNISMMFPVRECNGYLDRNRPDYDAMEKLAITIDTSSTLKPVTGFRTKAAAVEDEDVEVANSR
jgi:hypothetical protein